MNNKMDNKQFRDKSSHLPHVPQDPQIKALLGMVITSPLSDKLRETVLQAAKERLEQRTIKEKPLGYFKLYFQKRKLGIKPGQKETRVVYTLALAGILISFSLIYAFVYFIVN